MPAQFVRGIRIGQWNQTHQQGLQTQFLDSEVVKGGHRGKRIFIPRVTMTPSGCGLHSA